MQHDTLKQLLPNLRDAVDALSKCLTIIERELGAMRGAGSRVVPSMLAPKPEVASKPKPLMPTLMAIGRCESKILTALKLRPKGMTKIQIAIFTGYRSTSGSFNQAIADLLSDGLVVSFARNRKMVLSLTDAGKATVAHVKLSEPNVFEMWLTRLKTAERNILKTVVEAHPRLLDKEEIAKNTHYSITSGSFNQAIANLRKVDLITDDEEIGMTEEFRAEMRWNPITRSLE